MNPSESPVDSFLLTGIVEHMPMAVYVQDVRNNFQITVWNKFCELLFGIPQDKIIGHSLYDFFPKEQIDFHRRIDDLILSGRRPIHIPEEYSESLIHGRILLHSHKVPLFDKNNQISYIVTVSEEISERKKKDLELRSSEFLYRNLVEAVPVGIYKIDLQGKYVYVNEQWKKITGLNSEDLLEKAWGKRIVSEDKEKFLTAQQKMLLYGHELFVQYRWTHQNGSILTLLDRAGPLREESQDATGFVGTIVVIKDIQGNQ